MNHSENLTGPAVAVDLKPRDEDLDLFGLTHRGLIRSENQDHFLIGTLHRELVTHGTSLPTPEQLPVRGDRFATFAVVADGVLKGVERVILRQVVLARRERIRRREARPQRQGKG